MKTNLKTQYEDPRVSSWHSMSRSPRGFSIGPKVPIMKYHEKLLDPRWQKLRLAIFNRDEWTCRNCFDSENTLTMHHLSYSPGKDPWDYPLENFLTLCKNCHEIEFETRPDYEKMLLQIIRQKGFMADDIFRIISAFQKLSIIMPAEVTASIIEFMFDDDIMNKITPLYWDYCHKKVETMKSQL